MPRLLSLFSTLVLASATMLNAQVLVKNNVSFNAGHNPIQEAVLAPLHFDEARLPIPDDAQGLKVWHFSEADFGYYAVFDDPAIGTRQLLALYDSDKRITHVANLFTFTGEPQGRVQHIAYHEGLFYFNFGPDDIDMEPFQTFHLYCLDAIHEQLRWRSEGDDSRGQFLIDGDYIVSGYGGEGEPDYLYLIDRRTGITLSQCKMESRSRFMQLVNGENGQHYYDVTDYMNTVSRFTIRPRGVEVRGEGVRLRRGASVTSEIYSDRQGNPIYPLGGDVLEMLGEEPDWYRVRYNGENLYISAGYCERVTATAEPRDVMLAWMSDNPGQAPYEIQAIDVDGDGTMEYFVTNLENRQGFFTTTDGSHGHRAEDVELHCIHHEDLMHVDYRAKAVHFHMELPGGERVEELYVVNHSHVTEVWSRRADGECTRAVGGQAPEPVSERDYEARMKNIH